MILCWLILFVELMDCFFFFQAEDGIRDKLVTGVQTCALPISICENPRNLWIPSPPQFRARWFSLVCGKKSNTLACVEQNTNTMGNLYRLRQIKIGRASCRERV